MGHDSEIQNLQLTKYNQTVTTSTQPSEEPVDRKLLKTHIQFDLNDPDVNDWLDILVKAARRWAERFTSRTFVQKDLLLKLDDFPGDRVLVPRPPLVSVDSVKFTDSNGTTTTVDSADYHVNVDDEPGLIVLKDDKDWPFGTEQTTQAVEIAYTAGYGSSASDVPEDIRIAIAQLTAHYFEHRANVTQGAGVPRTVPMTVKSLLWPYRVMQLG